MVCVCACVYDERKPPVRFFQPFTVLWTQWKAVTGKSSNNTEGSQSPYYTDPYLLSKRTCCHCKHCMYLVVTQQNFLQLWRIWSISAKEWISLVFMSGERRHGDERYNSPSKKSDDSHSWEKMTYIALHLQYCTSFFLCKYNNHI